MQHYFMEVVASIYIVGKQDSGGSLRVGQGLMGNFWSYNLNDIYCWLFCFMVYRPFLGHLMPK